MKNIRTTYLPTAELFLAYIDILERREIPINKDGIKCYTKTVHIKRILSCSSDETTAMIQAHSKIKARMSEEP
jgi:hypothetical protein